MKIPRTGGGFHKTCGCYYKLECEGDVNPKQYDRKVQEALRKRNTFATAPLGPWSIYRSPWGSRCCWARVEAGVGKTEVAKVLAGIMETKLIRLQCYEVWMPIRRLRVELSQTDAALQAREVGGAIATPCRRRSSEEYLVKRPLLEAIQGNGAAARYCSSTRSTVPNGVRGLSTRSASDFQITIPELGTIRAKMRRIVFLTSNRTREIHERSSAAAFTTGSDYPTSRRSARSSPINFPGSASGWPIKSVLFMQQVRR